MASTAVRNERSKTGGMKLDKRKRGKGKTKGGTKKRKRGGKTGKKREKIKQRVRNNRKQ